MAAAELLGQLLLQDVERTDDGVSLKDGVSKDRMMSVHDPEMRHGRKSSSKRFDGHKAAIVVDTGTQLITAVEVLPGNASDNSGALELVEASEANTGVPVEETMGDAAYGDGDIRQDFADAERTLIARVPGRPDRFHFPKEDFHIDLAAGSCTCPGGQVTRRIRPLGTRTGPTGRTHQLKAFQFDGLVSVDTWIVDDEVFALISFTNWEWSCRIAVNVCSSGVSFAATGYWCPLSPTSPADLTGIICSPARNILVGNPQQCM